MKLRIRQRGNFNIISFRVVQGFLFTPMLLMPIGFIASIPIGSDWWMLLWMMPLSIFASVLGLYSLNEVVGFLGGHYLVYPKKNELVFQKTGSIWNHRYSVPLTQTEDLEWRERRSQLYFLKLSDWIYCSKDDSERIKRLFEKLIKHSQNRDSSTHIGK